jgi:hypothetical protein
MGYWFANFRVLIQDSGLRGYHSVMEHLVSASQKLVERTQARAEQVFQQALAGYTPEERRAIAWDTSSTSPWFRLALEPARFGVNVDQYVNGIVPRQTIRQIVLGCRHDCIQHWGRALLAYARAVKARVAAVRPDLNLHFQWADVPPLRVEPSHYKDAADMAMMDADLALSKVEGYIYRLEVQGVPSPDAEEARVVVDEGSRMLPEIASRRAIPFNNPAPANV